MKNVNFLDDMSADNPRQDCYTGREVRAHAIIKAHVLREVCDGTFDSLTLLIGNDDFSFDLSAGHNRTFLLKVRSGEVLAQQAYLDAEAAVEAAMAAYRFFVTLPRAQQAELSPDLPEFYLIDANGMTIGEDEYEVPPRDWNSAPIAAQNFEGRFIRAKIIPGADRSFTVVVVHYLDRHYLLADEVMHDFEIAKRFVNYYLEHCDAIAPPSCPEAVRDRAVASTMH